MGQSKEFFQQMRQEEINWNQVRTPLPTLSKLETTQQEATKPKSKKKCTHPSI